MQANTHPGPLSCLHHYPHLQHPALPVANTLHQESFEDVMEQLKVTLSLPYAQTEVSSTSFDDLSILDFITHWNDKAMSPVGIRANTPTAVPSTSAMISDKIRDNTGLPDPEKMMTYVNMVYDRYQHETDDLKDIVWRSDETTRKSVMANSSPLDLSTGQLPKDNLLESAKRSWSLRKSQLKASKKKIKKGNKTSRSGRKTNKGNSSYQFIERKNRGPPNVTISCPDYQTGFNPNPSTSHNQLTRSNVLQHDAYQQSLGYYSSSVVSDLSQQHVSSSVMSVHASASVSQAALLTHYTHWRQHYMPQLLASQNSNQNIARYQYNHYFPQHQPVDLSVSKRIRY